MEELPVEETLKLYDEKIRAAKNLMKNKNHDYGEAWREMSQESFVDLILAKVSAHKTNYYKMKEKHWSVKESMPIFMIF